MKEQNMKPGNAATITRLKKVSILTLTGIKSNTNKLIATKL